MLCMDTLREPRASLRATHPAICPSTPASMKKHGLDVSWRHVQGTEARYQQLESGAAHISMVVGRASLQHFLDTKTTRLLGCVMNSCSYYFVAAAGDKTRLVTLKTK